MNSERSQRAKEVIQQIIATVKINLNDKHCYMGRNPDDMSPWGLFFAYRICAYHTCTTGRETFGSDLAKVAKNMRDTFCMIDKRWNVAGIQHLLRLLLQSCYKPDLIYY